jgi:hypothetical protein
MHGSLERAAPIGIIALLLLSGCGGAGPSAVALPDDARAIGVAPDFAGTLWETTGSHPWR